MLCFPSFSAMSRNSSQSKCAYNDPSSSLNIKAEMNSPLFGYLLILQHTPLETENDCDLQFFFFFWGGLRLNKRRTFSQATPTFDIALYTTQFFIAMPKWSSAKLGKSNFIRSTFFRPLFFFSSSHTNSNLIYLQTAITVQQMLAWVGKQLIHKIGCIDNKRPPKWEFEDIGFC